MSIQRTIIRWTHIIISLPIAGYIYGAPLEVYKYRFGPRYIFIPIMVLSGLWMWQGHRVRRLFSSSPARELQRS